MNQQKVNSAIAQLNEAQGNLRKHDAIRAIEMGNYDEAIEILLDEGVEGYRGAVGSDQVRAIAEARKALYEALTEDSEPAAEIETPALPTTEQTYEDYVAIMDACDMTPEPRERWETNRIINQFKASFEGSERQQSIAKVWECGVEELSYQTLDNETIAWMNEALHEKAEISERRFRNIYSKRGNSQEWIEANVRDAILRGLDTEEHFLWLSELAHRAAPNDKEAQRWMIS